MNRGDSGMEWKLKGVSAITAFSICTCGSLLNAQEFEDSDFESHAFEEENEYDDNTLVLIEGSEFDDRDNRGVPADAYLVYDEENDDDDSDMNQGNQMSPSQSNTQSMQQKQMQQKSPVRQKAMRPVSCPPLAGDPTKNGWGVFVTADALVWKAKEDGLAYTIKNNAPINNNSSSVPALPNNNAKVKHFDFGWAGGFRVGMGYHFPKRKWDLGVNWTWYQQKSHAHTGTNANQELFAIWMAPTAVGNNLTTPFAVCTEAKAKWHLHYNVLDLDLGRSCAITRFFSVRPHGGFRSAWIHQKFDIDYINFPGSTTPLRSGMTSVDIGLKNNFWGWGIRTGIDTNWILGGCWSLFGNASYSLLWGNFHVKNGEVDNLVGPPPVAQLQVNLNNFYHTLRANLECAMGLRWDYQSPSERYHLAFSAGWEEQLWFDQNELNHLAQADNVVGFFKEHGDLGFSGLTVNVRFDF